MMIKAPTILAWRSNKVLVQKIVETLPYSAQWVKYNNKWREPPLSGRKFKELQRAAEFHQIPFPEVKKYTAPTHSAKHGFIKPFKGRKSHEKVNDVRIDEIAEKLKTMRPKIEKLRDEEKERRYKDFYDLGQFGKVGPKAGKGGRGVLYTQNQGKKKKDQGKNKKKK